MTSTPTTFSTARLCCYRWFSAVLLTAAAAGAAEGRPPETPGKTGTAGGVGGVADASADGIVNTGAKPATFPLDMAIAPDARIDFSVKIPKNGRVVFRTGRGAEAFTVVNRVESVFWDCTAPDGASVKKIQFWDRADYYPNGRIRPGFSYTDAMAAWNDHFAATRRRDIANDFFPAAFEAADGNCRAYLDGLLLAEWPATADLYGKKPAVELSPGAALNVKNGAPRKIGECARDFFPVDIAFRVNADAPAYGGASVVDGVPFEAPPEGGVVDLGQSWFREGNSQADESSHIGSFGGRWGGALGGSPTRMQFRVPYRQYDAVYLLAACEKRDDRIPRVTAQFFRTGSGFPKSFSADVVPDGVVRLVKIPVEPGALTEFSDRSVVEVELTGDVHEYRAYPDPLYYSSHGAGVPSGVRVYAMTLGVSPLEVEFEPEAPGNLWVEPSRPGYRVKVRNRGPEDREVRLALRTASFDAEEKTEQFQTLRVGRAAEVVTRFDLSLAKFGWHSVVLDVDGRRSERSLTVLRRREYRQRPFDAKGFMFGYWNWAGAHHTPANHDAIRLMGAMGMESVAHSPNALFGHEVFDDVRRYGMKTFWAHSSGLSTIAKVEDAAGLMGNNRLGVSAVNEPVFVNLFAEPGGIGTEGNPPEFFGEPDAPFTADQQAKFDGYKRAIVSAHAEIRRQSPNAKILMPWGDPLFSVPFLKDPETRELFDGIAFDAGYFDRLPEQQIHQCSLHRMFQFHELWKRYRRDPPVLVTMEGPQLSPVAPGALTEEQSAAHIVRVAMILGAYGVNRQFSVSTAADCASYWGEQHYGGGLFSRLSDLNPHVAVASVGTMIRHLRHMEFVGWLPLGSLSAYCLEFKDSRNGDKLYVMWTIRGKRPVRMKHGRVFDAMDNPLKSPVLTQMPIFVYGGDGAVELGEPDHSDAVLAPDHIKLGRAADLFVRQSRDEDDEYVNSFPVTIRRFPAAMDFKAIPEGLEIPLPPQEIDRGTMPYYAAMHPEKPIAIPGKAKYISLEVSAASDWGRVVYVLRDAKGERWISVGSRDAWNCDDAPGASYFNFDGKRLVRFELPSHLPWDDFREMGTTWWGASAGDNVVDLPLSIEKIFIERRAKAMYVNSLEAASTAPVVLGDLYAEYDSPEMAAAQPEGPRMPPPPAGVARVNPIAELAASAAAALPASEITGVAHPERQYDGRRGVFDFREVAGAAYYDIYIGRSPDGEGALKLGSGIRKSGALVSGFLPNVDFYAFVVCRARDGGHSTPSAGFKFNLRDEFGNK